MKKFTSFIAIAAAASCLLASSVGANGAILSPETNGPSDLLVLGDSIATGYGLDGYNADDNNSAAESFGSLLAENYGLTFDETYFNFASNGLTTGLLSESFDTPEGEDGTLTQHIADSDAIVISIGGDDFLLPFIGLIGSALEANSDAITALGVEVSTGNDSEILATLNAALAADTDGALMTTLMTTLGSTDTINTLSENVTIAGDNIRTILSSIFDINPDTNVFLFTVYNPFSGAEGYESMNTVTNIVFNALNNSIKTIVEEANENNSATVIDVAGLFKDNGATYTNINDVDIHPNAAGHEVIYNAITAAFDTIFTDASDDDDDTADDDDDGKDNPGTGVIISIVPAVAAGAVLIISKKRTNK